ncbi:MAG: FG-GAP-like repeat-containing protein, partial [Prosthecobacter sp.]|nr:FG-GAP-like repeat-containing protein [Prosthecobacter sp.]
MLRYPWPWLAPLFILLISSVQAAPGILWPDYDLAAYPASSLNSPRARLTGGAAGDGLGRITRTGDVNGDGRDDLIVGTDTGKIHVWFGGSNFSGPYDVAGTAGSRPQVTLNGFAALRALAVGDVDGDGRADIIVGFTPTEKGSGNAAIVLGRSYFPSSLSLEITGSEGATVLIQPQAAGDGLAEGGALALGDLNADGKLDIILGAPLANGHGYGRLGSGEAYIIFGRSFIPPELSLDSGGFSGFSVLIIGASANDALTKSGALHTADVNGDGKTDLILGAPDADGPAEDRPGSGEAYVILGRTSFVLGEELDLILQGNYHGANLTLYGAAPGDALTGGGVASGDVDGDGKQDILLSAPLADGPQGERSGAGQAYVVLGRSPLPATLDMRYCGGTSPDTKLRGADLILYGANANDALAERGALAAADVNGDGLADLIAGAHAAPNTLTNATSAGQIHIVFGRRDLAAVPVVVDAKPGSPSKPDVTIFGARKDDHLSRGGALLAADLDGDGLADIITGSDAAAGFGSGSRPGAGRGYIILGRPNFHPFLNLGQEGDFDDGPSVQLRGATTNDGLTKDGALAVGDVNGDGDIDLIIGAPAADGPWESRADAGEVYVVNGVGRAEIAVLDPKGTNAEKGDVLDLGKVGLNTGVSFPFTVKNTGRRPLLSVSTQHQEMDATLFALSPDDLFTPIPQYGSRTFDLLFSSKTLGIKKTMLRINSSDSDENPFDLEIQVEVVKAVPPVAKTQPAIVGATTVNLGGLVNPKGITRRVFFDYGPTSSYGDTIEVDPVPSDCIGDKPVTFMLTDLQLDPHTRYHYRIRAASHEGAAAGADMTFATLNSTPVAEDDSFTVTSGSTVPLYVLGNDSDPDNDLLSIASFTQPKADGKPMGKVAKVDGSLVFTAPADFTVAATFSYTAKDAYGGTSAAATVTIEPGTATIDPPAMTQLAAGGTYMVSVTTESLWSITESIPWITASIRNDTPPTLADISLLRNPSTSDRSAVIMIAGQSHQITQKGVIKPALSMPVGGAPPGLVGNYYVMSIGLENGPVTFTINSLPPGLIIDGDSVITGVPTRAGVYPVTIKARNAAGAADQVLNFDIIIAPLNGSFAGSYLGFINRTDPLSPLSQGARLELTTTTSGGVSGKLISGLASMSFTAKISPETADPDQPEVSIPLPTRNEPGRVLRLTFDTAQHTLSGKMGDSAGGEVIGWRNDWNPKTNRATAYSGLHTFSLVDQNSPSEAPPGYGYGSFTVNEGTGALTVTGKLPDNSAFSTTGFIGQNGQVLIYQPLYTAYYPYYPQLGLFSGVITVAAGVAPADNSISSTTDFGPQWFKPAAPPSAHDTVYANGFVYNAQMRAEGGAYLAPAPGNVVMGLPNQDSNASIQFTFGGLPAESVHVLSLRNPAANGLVNKATPVPPVANSLTMPVLNAATGVFSGTFTLAGTTAALNRKVTYQG